MVLWELAAVTYYERSHHMPTTMEQLRQMQTATVWGTNVPGTPTVDSTVRDGASKEAYFDGLNTGSAIINSVLQPQTRGYFYSDFPVAPYRKWIPASPPQPAPGFGVGNFTDPATLDPRVVYSDQYTPMGHSHLDAWMTLRRHLVWIVLAIIVGSILLEYGHWSYPSTKDVSK